MTDIIMPSPTDTSSPPLPHIAGLPPLPSVGEVIGVTVVAADAAATTNSGDDQSAARDCKCRKSFIGCQFRALLPVDKCSEPGCVAVFHHGCETEWTMAQYRKDDPDGIPGDNWYDSEGGKKFCMEHHPFSDIALSTSLSWTITVPSTQPMNRQLQRLRKRMLGKRRSVEFARGKG